MRSTTTPSLRFRGAMQRRLAWLLWLALVLPMAQGAATWHAMSHAALEASGAADGTRAPHQTHCDLCLTAAAIGGGGPPSESPALPLEPSVAHALPQAAVGGIAPAPSALAYRSRAPPVLLS